MEYQPIQSLVLSPEYTYQRKRSWNHFTDLVTSKKGRALRDKFHLILFSFSCRYYVDDRNYINLSGARRVQKSRLSAEENSDYASVSISRLF
jgi:hypothetical protein